MAVSKVIDRIANDREFAENIKKGSDNDYSLFLEDGKIYSSYCLDDRNIDKNTGIESIRDNDNKEIGDTGFKIYNIYRRNKNKAFLIGRTRQYFKGARNPEDYDFFLKSEPVKNVIRIPSKVSALDSKDYVAFCKNHFVQIKDSESAEYLINECIIKEKRPILFSALDDANRDKCIKDVDKKYDNLSKEEQEKVEKKAKLKYYEKVCKEFLLPEQCYSIMGTYKSEIDPNRDDFHRYVNEYKNRVKHAICLHYTASPSVKGDLNTLFGKFREAVHYVVGRDGSIYRLFEDNFYSGHLGNFEEKGSINKNLEQFNGKLDGNPINLHNQSISIEISNLGYDVEKNSYDKTEKNNFKLAHKYRGKDYYEPLSTQQEDAVCALVYYLVMNTGKKSCLNIPSDVWRVDSYDENKAAEYKKLFGSEQDYYDYGSKFSSLDEANRFKGVFTHTDYRFTKSDFPTEIMQKIRKRYQALYGHVIDEKERMVAYIALRCKQLQEKGYSMDEINRIIYNQMVKKICVSEEDLLYTDSDYTPLDLANPSNT